MNDQILQDTRDQNLAPISGLERERLPDSFVLLFDLNLSSEKLSKLLQDLRDYLGTEISDRLKYCTWSNYSNPTMHSLIVEGLPDPENFTHGLEESNLVRTTSGSSLPDLLAYLSYNLQSSQNILIFTSSGLLRESETSMLTRNGSTITLVQVS